MTSLQRSISMTGAVAIGVTSMIGAGLFVVFAPAAAAAEGGLALSLCLAGAIAICNAVSSSRLAVRYPQSGGTYVYASRQLSPLAGHLAGWAFLLGKTASCAAMAWAIGLYAAPDHARSAGTVALLIVTAVNLCGVERSTRVMVVVGSIVVLAVVVACILMLSGPSAASDGGPVEPLGVLEGAALLFFAFAGYARLSTLGEEVQDPKRTIPRAIVTAIVIAGALYALVLVAMLDALGSELADSSAPFADALIARNFPSAASAIAVVAIVAAAGALLSLCLGVSRTMLAMARDGHLPRQVAIISSTRIPWVAEVVVVVAAIVALWTLDLRATVGFSSCCVLIYYAFANASAFTLGAPAGRLVATLGTIGCLALALALPTSVWLVACVALGVLSLTRNRSGQQRHESEGQADQTKDEGDGRNP